MNIKKFLITGAKVIVGVVAGVAAFLGINKLIKNEEEVLEENNINVENKINENLEKNNIDDNSSYTNKFQKTVTGFKSAQNVLGKIFVLFQSLTLLIENFSRVFSKDSISYQQVNTGYGPNWGYNQDIVVDPSGKYWSRRVSPFITEVGTFENNSGSNYQSNQFQNQYYKY